MMRWIASQTFPSGGSGTFVQFTNIPQEYDHLQFRIYSRSGNTGAAGGIYMAGNSYHITWGNGTTTGQSSWGSVTNSIMDGIGNSSTAGTFNGFILDIFDYSKTTKGKTFKWVGGWDANGSGFAEVGSGGLTSTAAVTSWFFDTGAPNYFTQGSRFDLYGITSNPVATGA
jgi:hypothetical protein